MSEEKQVLVEQQGQIAIITINRPKALNALNTSVYHELDAILDEIEAMEDVRCIVLTGSARVDKEGNIVPQKQSFVAGADIAQMKDLDVAGGKFFGNDGNAICRRLENFPVPVIAAINGFCLGGGCELAMCCDIRLASEHASFGQPEVGLGITPGCGGTQRLARLVGMGKAKEMIYTARASYTAQDALAMGLVNYVYPYEQLMEEAMKLAKTICKQAPVAVRLCKEAINVGCQMDLDSALKYEANCFAQCFATEDQTNGMTDFVEKKKGPDKHPFLGK